MNKIKQTDKKGTYVINILQIEKYFQGYLVGYNLF